MLDPEDFVDHRSGLGASATPTPVDPGALQAGLRVAAVVARPDPAGSHPPSILVAAGAVVGDGAGGFTLHRAPGLAGGDALVPTWRGARARLDRALRPMARGATWLLDFPGHVLVSDGSTSLRWPKAEKPRHLRDGALVVGQLVDMPLEHRARFDRVNLIGVFEPLEWLPRDQRRRRALERRAVGKGVPRSPSPAHSWPSGHDGHPWEEAEHDGWQVQLLLRGTSAAPELRLRIRSPDQGTSGVTRSGFGYPDAGAGAAAEPLALQGMVDLATLWRALSVLRGATVRLAAMRSPEVRSRGGPTPDYLVLEDVVEDGGDALTRCFLPLSPPPSRRAGGGGGRGGAGAAGRRGGGR